ncbi:uncharacterized protein LOC100378379 [Saccoglossus kowalevskii]|uniref:Uncharacterized protein LOC100378379 n=1 Tax=Saccoglossus kowalevskii TaxID=10224 RepID=A0ABM0GSV8_SACKO|nr:PREDICTED: uncharacterized protein LOC100378379 [Saccoglossus kowalevskii]
MAASTKSAARRPTPNLPVRVAYDRFEFNPCGTKLDVLIRQDPSRAQRIHDISQKTNDEAERLLRHGRYTGHQSAFRHALLMYRIACEFGADVAKSFGDAHELASSGSLGERLMNLYNNWVGRTLACDPAHKGKLNKGDINLIWEALHAGHLQTLADSTYAPLPTDKNKIGSKTYHGFL